MIKDIKRVLELLLVRSRLSGQDKKSFAFAHAIKALGTWIGIDLRDAELHPITRDFDNAAVGPLGASAIGSFQEIYFYKVLFWIHSCVVGRTAALNL